MGSTQGLNQITEIGNIKLKRKLSEVANAFEDDYSRIWTYNYRNLTAEQ